jgi:hypothetical protein
LLVFPHNIRLAAFRALLESCGAVMEKLTGIIRVITKVMHLPPFVLAGLLFLPGIFFHISYIYAILNT